MLPRRESYSLEQLPHNSSILENYTTDKKKNDFSNRSNIRYIAFLSLFYLTLQTVSVQLISIIVKKLFYSSICQLSLTRFAGIFSISLPIAIIQNEHILGGKNSRFLLAFRCLFTASGLLLHMASFRYLQLVEVSIVRCTHPFFTAIIARVFLKERFGRVQTVTLLITICGVLLSLRLPEKLSRNLRSQFDISFVLGLIMSVGSVLVLAAGSVATRKLKNVHFSIMLLHMGFIGTLQNGILNATFFPLVPISCGWDQLLCVLIGVLGVCADSLNTLALKLEPAGIVSLERSSLEVLVSAILQILFFSDYPDIYIISGSCLVIVSLSIMGVRNWILTMPVSYKTRQKFKWILT